MRELSCAHVLTAADAAATPARTIRIDGDRIAAVEPASSGEPVLALPVLVNAHDHARAVRSSSFGAAGKPLETWLHYLALAAVGRSLSRQRGVACPQRARRRRRGDGALHSRAGADRLADRGLARWRAPPPTSACASASPSRMRDRNPLVYGPSEPILAGLSARSARRDQPQIHPRAAVRRRSSWRWSMRSRRRLPARPSTCNTDRRACSGARPSCSPRLPKRRNAPAGAFTCISSRRAISAAGPTTRIPTASCAISTGSGCLSPRLTLAHCTWARPDELELIAERGATIAVNTSSNLGSAIGHRSARRNGPPRLPGGARARRSRARRRR